MKYIFITFLFILSHIFIACNSNCLNGISINVSEKELLTNLELMIKEKKQFNEELHLI